MSPPIQTAHPKQARDSKQPLAETATTTGNIIRIGVHSFHILAVPLVQQHHSSYKVILGKDRYSKSQDLTKENLGADRYGDSQSVERVVVVDQVHHDEVEDDVFKSEGKDPCKEWDATWMCRNEEAESI